MRGMNILELPVPARGAKAEGHAFVPGVGSGPRLGVRWERRGQSFLGNLRAVLLRVRLPRRVGAQAYFRDASVRTRVSRGALATSLLAHFVLFVFPVPARWFSEELLPVEAARLELVWHGAARDLPLILPRAKPARPRPAATPSKPAEKPPVQTGSETFHPRQLIVSAPARPNHPRQTLVQPDAPAVAPKILPPLPNIVAWGKTARPAKPKLIVDPRALARMRTRRAPARHLPEPAIPALPNAEPNAGEINIAASAPAPARPKLAVTAMSTPRTAARRMDTGAASAGPAPEIGPTGTHGENGLGRLIALSATPAEPESVVEVPMGNLAARLSMGPNLGAPPPGVAGGNGTGTVAGTSGAAGNGTGPSFISITGGGSAPVSTVAGPGGAETGSGASPSATLPAKPEPRLRGFDAGRGLGAGVSPGMRPGVGGSQAPMSALERIQAGSPPDAILSAKRVYTLHVNAPNLASATGSWVLSFAELGAGREGEAGRAGSLPGEELQGPVPLRKVDPAYPPALVSARIEGDVVLYAIIRRDGSVDSIQVVKHLEPQLDQNAMEALARWQFRPAERNGAAVEIEAVVRIPFRFAARF